MSTSAELALSERAYDDPTVAALIAELQLEYVRRYGEPDLGSIDPTEFVPPHGVLVVGELGGGAVAMGGWRTFAPGVAELKRMYVVESARGRGLSRQLLRHLESSAARAGCGRMILNTGTQQPEAVALYESSEYTPIAGFGHYAEAEQALFYGKDLPPE